MRHSSSAMASTPSPGGTPFSIRVVVELLPRTLFESARWNKLYRARCRRNAKVPCLKKNRDSPALNACFLVLVDFFFCCCSHRQCRPSPVGCATRILFSSGFSLWRPACKKSDITIAWVDLVHQRPAATLDDVSISSGDAFFGIVKSIARWVLWRLFVSNYIWRGYSLLTCSTCTSPVIHTLKTGAEIRSSDAFGSPDELLAVRRCFLFSPSSDHHLRSAVKANIPLLTMDYDRV
jgi:hypothetical protein